MTNSESFKRMVSRGPSYLSIGGEKKILVKGLRLEENLVWLKKSLVCVSCNDIGVAAFQSVILIEGFNNILVKSMGGRKFLLTFPSE